MPSSICFNLCVQSTWGMVKVTHNCDRLYDLLYFTYNWKEKEKTREKRRERKRRWCTIERQIGLFNGEKTIYSSSILAYDHIPILLNVFTLIASGNCMKKEDKREREKKVWTRGLGTDIRAKYTTPVSDSSTWKGTRNCTPSQPINRESLKYRSHLYYHQLIVYQ